jgi:hypothetical protein
MSFSRFCAGPCLQDHPAALGRILDSGKLVTIVPRLEFAGLLKLQDFVGESPGGTSHQSGRSMSVHRYRMGPASSGIHPQDLMLIPLPPSSRSEEK